jgi:hypothetical protein
VVVGPLYPEDEGIESLRSIESIYQMAKHHFPGDLEPQQQRWSGR